MPTTSFSAGICQDICWFTGFVGIPFGAIVTPANRQTKKTETSMDIGEQGLFIYQDGQTQPYLDSQAFGGGGSTKDG